MKAKNLVTTGLMFTVLLVLITITAGAQGGFKGLRKQRLQTDKEDIEALKVAFITRKLNLTVEEAKKFWPIYQEFEARKKELNKQAVSKYQKILTDSLSEKQAEEMLNQQIVQAQQMLDLRKEYLLKLKDVLSSKKIAKLYEAEKNFRRILMKQIRGKRRNNQGGE